ncbi:MAG: thiamine diphosphokinase [Anaerovoracaceae bacterium]|nr:thiamine diphosphokinase [Bacillota bacterium]MDD7733734.1 thiamine diphosphokinase [Bacillota bacterium]MDY5907178.1 thiamine diphosphokinase [Anaerovoracaceae bacterium]
MSEFCLIISGAPECYFPVSFTKADFVIACDAGYIHAQRADIVPDVIIGDFDSYLGDLPGGVEIIRTKPEKDDTDTMMALKLAIRRGYRRIMLVGALGGRIDHMLANISLIAFAATKGADLQIVDGHHQIFAVRDGKRRVPRSSWRNLSVFAFDTECTGVTLRGVKYPLEGAVLTNTFALGVSNEFAEDIAEISVESGILIVVLSDII